MTTKKSENLDTLLSPSDIKFEELEHRDRHSTIWTEYPPGYLVSEFVYTEKGNRTVISFSVKTSKLATASENDHRMIDILITDEKIDASQIRQAIFDHYQKITSEGLPQPRNSVLDTLL